MKKITFIAAIFAGLTLNAQETIYSEDFTSEDLSGWELYDEDGDGNNWGDVFQVTDADGNPVTPVSLISRSWQSFPLTPDNWAVTPAIDLTESGGDIELSWKVMAAAAAWDSEKYSVYVGTSSDIDDLVDSDITFSEVYDDPANAGTQYTRTLDLSSLSGESVYIAFRHHDVTDMDFISIDDILVTGEVLSVNSNEFSGFTHFVKNNELILSAKNPIQTLSLYNMLGQEILSQKLNSSNGTIDISSLQSGVYLTKVSIDGATKTFKILKN